MLSRMSHSSKISTDIRWVILAMLSAPNRSRIIYDHNKLPLVTIQYSAFYNMQLIHLSCTRPTPYSQIPNDILRYITNIILETCDSGMPLYDIILRVILANLSKTMCFLPCKERTMPLPLEDSNQGRRSTLLLPSAELPNISKYRISCDLKTHFEENIALSKRYRIIGKNMLWVLTPLITESIEVYVIYMSWTLSISYSPSCVWASSISRSVERA